MKPWIICVLMLVATSGYNAAAADVVSALRVSTPLILSGSYGLRLGDKLGSMRPTIQAEAGIGGGRIAVGFDNTGESTFGYAFRAALIRTWLKPIEVDKDQTFLGIDIEFSIKRFLIGLGGYRRISDGNDDWIMSAGLGFVF